MTCPGRRSSRPAFPRPCTRGSRVASLRPAVARGANKQKSYTQHRTPGPDDTRLCGDPVRAALYLRFVGEGKLGVASGRPVVRAGTWVRLATKTAVCTQDTVRLHVVANDHGILCPDNTNTDCSKSARNETHRTPSPCVAVGLRVVVPGCTRPPRSKGAAGDGGLWAGRDDPKRRVNGMLGGHHEPVLEP